MEIEKRNETSVPQFSLSEGQVKEVFNSCSTATEYLLLFISDSEVKITYETNLYAAQRNKIYFL